MATQHKTHGLARTLSGEGSITVQQDGHHALALRVTAVVLLGTSLALQASMHD